MLIQQQGTIKLWFDLAEILSSDNFIINLLYPHHTGPDQAQDPGSSNEPPVDPNAQVPPQEGGQLFFFFIDSSELDSPEQSVMV